MIERVVARDDDDMRLPAPTDAVPLRARDGVPSSVACLACGAILATKGRATGLLSPDVASASTEQPLALRRLRAGRGSRR